MSDSRINDRQYDVFLSHNSKDKEAVRKLKDRLKADGLKVWFDERELRVGDELHKAIAEGLDQSRVCAVFIGSDGFGPWHDWEIGLAIDMHVNSPAFRLIPVILPRESKTKFLPSEVPLWLRGLLWVEFPKLNDDEPYQRLKDGILGRGSDFTPRANRQIEEDTETNITPRGLRSFEEDDKHFFLRLVAGPRDHRGLPVSIAFWKNRLEQVDPDKTFRVGLLFGPSGCGKSSLVKAGLLPRLHQYVKTIYLAATPDRTEQQLLNAVRKQVPGLPGDLGLVESLAHLTSHPDVLKDFKLVIVLDQFEQWLHSNLIIADAPLIAALRQCDAAILQAVVMVRADFYVETHRLFEQLNGVKIQDDINADLIDLFDRDHARNVLLEYGRAYGRFTDPQSLNFDEETFLAETLDQLQDGDQRLIAVQLALFADLMKNKPWTGAVLKKLGGATGVGRAFLEENFDAKTANATQRFHRKAAATVLRALLPPRGAGIKGTSKTKSELMLAASYQSRPEDFEGLLGVLLNDLKLISPVACEEDSSSPESPAVDPRYQLSHDYLVPSLRDWLTSKDRESWRGRARLLLEERTTEWVRDSENSRHFPSVIQWLQIQCGVPRRHRSPASHRLLRKSIRHHVVRTVVALIFVPLLWFGKEFCTFQAEFTPFEDHRRQEIVITRRFDPRPKAWQFRQGTCVFADERDTATEDMITGHLELNVGWSPDWSPLVPFLADSRLGLAEMEWLDRAISVPMVFLRDDPVGWARVSPAATDALFALLKSSNFYDRHLAAEALGKVGKSDVAVIAALVVLLKDQNSQVRSSAAASLVQLGNSDAALIDVLVVLLHDQTVFIRSSAAASLGQLGKKDVAVIDALVALLKDQDSEVRSSALASLVALGKRDMAVIDALISLLKERHTIERGYVHYFVEKTLGTLAKSDVAVIDLLVSLLKDEDRDVRASAAATLGALVNCDLAVLNARVALLKDQDGFVRSSAATSLGQLGKSDPTVIDALVTLLKDQNGFVRSSAAASLGQLGKSDPAVIDALVTLLKDQFGSVRSSAAASLVQLGRSDANVIAALVAWLKDDDNYVRARAAESLAQLGKCDANVIEALVASLKDQERGVRDPAAKAIGKLAQDRSEWTDKRMIADLADNDSSVRERAGIVLAYRREKVDSELAPDEARRLKDIRDQVEGLRKDARPWVKQASLHALYHIEKRKAELEAARRTSKQETAQSK